MTMPSRRVAAAKPSELLPDDLERVLHHGAVSVLICRRRGNIWLDDGRKVAAAGLHAALEAEQAHGARGRHAAAHLDHQRVDDALLLALHALFQAIFDGGLLAHLVFYADEQIDHLLLLERLEQIALYAVFERVLRVFKLAVAADDDKMQAGLYLLGLPDEIDAVAAGHTDVRHQQVRRFLAHELERGHAVVRRADDLKAEALPVDQLLHQQQDFLFVIGQYDL